MRKMLGRKALLVLVGIFVFSAIAHGATSDFTANGNITVDGVAADNNDLTDLTIMSGSTAESWQFSGSNLNVTNPGTYFRVSAASPVVGAIEATSGGSTVCAGNNTPGTSYVELTTSQTGTYRIVPLKSASCSSTSNVGSSGGGGGAKKKAKVVPTVPASPAPAAQAIANASPNAAFLRPLVVGSTGADVMALQKFLNSNGFSVAAMGAGSAGQETSYFGLATRAAVLKFQLKNAIVTSENDPGAGRVGPLTRAKLNESGSAPAPLSNEALVQSLQAQLEVLKAQLRVLQGQ